MITEGLFTPRANGGLRNIVIFQLHISLERSLF